jgi:mediator of RNA polymerase II transcription subunit 14
MARYPFALVRLANCGICLRFRTVDLLRRGDILSALKDYTVSISCEDQLSTGGNFDLRFSRCDSGLDSFNPHDDAEPFLRNILRHGHGRLAPSLHRLVTFLRETLPIAVELEEIRQQSEGAVDTFAKAAGWYRLLFGDSRCLLSFRGPSHR